MFGLSTLPPGTYPYYDLLGWGAPRKTFPFWMWIGLFIMVLSEIQLFRQAEPFYTHFTLIVWWGYLLFVDGIIKFRRGKSFLADRPRFFLFLALISAFWWLVFEFYNCYLENWVYIGVPVNIPHRYACYILAFATITPAILTTLELMLTLWPPTIDLDHSRKLNRRRLSAWFLFGTLCVSVPLLIPSREIRHYLFGFVWLGFIFLIEPLAYWAGSFSLLRLWMAGKRRLIGNVLSAGAVCGLLWEFWNYWAGAKWLYTVPVTQTLRYFEMPILGFLGFLPFAWECLMLSVFSALIIGTVRITPLYELPSRKMIWISRSILAALFGVFIAAYLLHDRRHFPLTSFRSFSEPKLSSNEIDHASAIARYLEKIMNQPEQIDARDQLLGAIFFAWKPEYATREILSLLGELQRSSDPQIRNCADQALREYALSLRFNWAERNLKEGR